MVANQVQSTFCCVPKPMDIHQREMLAIKAAGALFEAMKCADKSYSAAGITFVQDGRFTKAKFKGITVASLIGRFNKESLLNTIRSNIADHAHWVGVDIVPILTSQIILPQGYTFRLDMEPQLIEIRNRGTRMVSGYVRGKPSADNQALQFHAEFHIGLQACQAHLIVSAGDRLNPGEDLLAEGEHIVTAETYPELGEKIAQRFNQAIARATATSSMQ
ncbi:hypothetical protein [Pseudomonas sp. NPDC089569]|uniref:hypothetical protein n=1 Tax=Pseudomonas sp. NPDC089569 TaxID=3390722 RepID=UPI003D042327